MSYYSTDPNAAGRSPAELNGKAASNLVAFIARLNDETPEALAGTHRWTRCDSNADGALRLIRGEEGFVMRPIDTHVRMVPVRVAKDKFSDTVELEDGAGETVTVTVDPDGITAQDLSMEEEKPGTSVLVSIPARITGTWFEGTIDLVGSEWIDKDLVFEGQASHFECNDRVEWEREIATGPNFAQDTWAAVKTIVLTHCRGALRSARRSAY